jgi:putative FmdB family regulatory protein
MPVYDFRCQDCCELVELSMHVDEFEQKRDKGLECPKCHGKNLRTELTTFEVKTSRKSAAW